MTTIEERVASALLDLQELLEEGNGIDSALKEAAASYGLRPDVLAKRAAPDGKLNDYCEKVRTNARLKDNKRLIAEAVGDFVTAGIPWFERSFQTKARLSSALEKVLGRPASAYELTFASETMVVFRRNRQNGNFQQLRRMIAANPERLHADD